MSEKVEWRELREYEDGSVAVIEYFYYGRSSVLAGSLGKRVAEFFESKTEALKEYPDADNEESYVPRAEVPREPPAGYYGGGGGFYEAGEYWGEDDY